jgi:hypothetical protein
MGLVLEVGVDENSRRANQIVRSIERIRQGNLLRLHT